MKDFKNKFIHWSETLSAFNALLKPILDVPYSEDSSPHLIQKEIDQLNINQSVQDIVNEVMLVFSELNASQRQDISALIYENDRILWALDSGEQTVTMSDLDQEVLWFIIRDQGRDTRDAILELNEIITNGEKLGLDVKVVLKKYAPLASTVDKFGWGSTQNLILGSIK